MSPRLALTWKSFLTKTNMTALLIITLVLLALSIFVNVRLYRDRENLFRAYKNERRGRALDNVMAVCGVLSLVIINRIARNLED